MRKFIENKFACVAMLSLCLLASASNAINGAVSPAALHILPLSAIITVAHGPLTPPDPWEGTLLTPPDPWEGTLVAHGPLTPPDPWEGTLVAHGPLTPPDPWEGTLVAHGPLTPPDPWEGTLVAHGPLTPPDPWEGTFFLVSA